MDVDATKKVDNPFGNDKGGNDNDLPDLTDPDNQKKGGGDGDEGDEPSMGTEKPGNYTCPTCPQPGDKNYDPRYQSLIDDKNNNYEFDSETGIVKNTATGTTYIWDAGSSNWAFYVELDEVVVKSSEPPNPIFTAIGGVTGIAGEGAAIAEREITGGVVYATKSGAKGVKALGAASAGLGLVSSGIQYYVSDRNPSDKARLGGAIGIAATNFIPEVGPEISFGLGTADAAGVFDGFYKSFDTPGVPRIYLRFVTGF